MPFDQTPPAPRRTAAVGPGTALAGLLVAAAAILAVINTGHHDGGEQQVAAPPSVTAGAPATSSAVAHGAVHVTLVPNAAPAHAPAPAPRKRVAPRATHAVPRVAATSAAPAGGSVLTVGVVDVVSQLTYQHLQAAGTGMVMSANGEVLTNNHVIDGATSVRVTVVSTGRSYPAVVMGTDAADDVAVLQVTGASGLATADFGNSSAVQLKDAVTAVGNAGGAGGAPAQVAGQITGLGEAVTATAEDGSDPEHLAGMLESDAPIVAGDSGGPLYDTAGQVVGMDTAAAQTAAGTATTTRAFAIPIDNALSVAGQIVAGRASGVVQIGTPAFLGVAATDGAGGAQVESVVPGSAAAAAGIDAGDVIFDLNGTSVTSAADLHAALAACRPGELVTVSWESVTGDRSAQVTLGDGPAV